MNFIVNYLTSWFSIILSGLGAVFFFLCFIYVKFRPAIMVKFVHRVLRFIRNALKSNKAFMRWLYGPECNDEVATHEVKLINDWRKGGCR